MNLLLDPVTHKLVHAKQNLAQVTGIDEVAQRLKCRLKTLKGEWYLDPDLGLIDREVFLGAKPADLGECRRRIRTICVETRGVVSVSEITLELDAERGLKVRIEAVGEDGDFVVETSSEEL